MDFKNYNHQVLISLILKGGSILASLLFIRLCFETLDVDSFGAWMVILSLYNYIIFLDLGTANSLKNQLSSVSNRQTVFQETFWRGLKTMTALAMLAYLGVNSIVLSLQESLNYDNFDFYQISISYQLALIFLCLNIALSSSVSAFYALEKSSYIFVGQFVVQAACIFFLFAAKLMRKDLLVLSEVAVTYSGSLALGNLVLLIILFKKYWIGKPKIISLVTSKIDLDLVRIGIKYFVCQSLMSGILISDKVLIQNSFGYQQAGSFEVTFRVFWIVMILHSMLNAPLWPMFLKSHAAQDRLGMINGLRRTIYISGLLMLICVILFILNRPIIYLWLGDGAQTLSYNDLIWLCVFLNVLIVYGASANILNALGLLSSQLWCLAFAVIVKLYYYNFAMEDLVTIGDVLMLSTVTLVPFCVVGPYIIKNVLSRLNKVHQHG